VQIGLPNRSKALWPSRSAAFRFVDEAPLERVEDFSAGAAMSITFSTAAKKLPPLAGSLLPEARMIIHARFVSLSHGGAGNRPLAYSGRRALNHAYRRLCNQAASLAA
jgi:hypothetical protein